MTKEEMLKAYILTKYKSIREFVGEMDMPYSTFDTILKRGLDTASIKNVLKICAVLEISADELAEGHIVPLDSVQKKGNPKDVQKIIDYARTELLNNSQYTLDGQPLSMQEAQRLLDSVEVTVELIRRERQFLKKMSAYTEKFSETGSKK